MKEILKAEVKCQKREEGAGKVEVTRKALKKFVGKTLIVKVYEK